MHTDIRNTEIPAKLAMFEVKTGFLCTHMKDCVETPSLRGANRHEQDVHWTALRILCDSLIPFDRRENGIV
jgi:hypothetical protein